MKLIRHPSRCFYIKHPRSIRYHTKRPKGPEQFGGRSMLWWPTTFLATEPYKYIVYLFIHSIIEIYTIFWIKWYQAHLFMSMQSQDIQCFMSAKKHNVSEWRFYTTVRPVARGVQGVLGNLPTHPVVHSTEHFFVYSSISFQNLYIYILNYESERASTCLL